MLTGFVHIELTGRLLLAEAFQTEAVTACSSSLVNINHVLFTSITSFLFFNYHLLLLATVMPATQLTNVLTNPAWNQLQVLTGILSVSCIIACRNVAVVAR